MRGRVPKKSCEIANQPHSRTPPRNLQTILFVPIEARPPIPLEGTGDSLESSSLPLLTPIPVPSVKLANTSIWLPSALERTHRNGLKVRTVYIYDAMRAGDCGGLFWAHWSAAIRRDSWTLLDSPNGLVDGLCPVPRASVFSTELPWRSGVFRATSRVSTESSHFGPPNRLSPFPLDPPAASTHTPRPTNRQPPTST